MVINYEDEFNEGTQSLIEKEGEKDEDETSAHLTKAFGSTIQSEFEFEINKATIKQGFSPRGRKEIKQYKNFVTTSTSCNASRPNTRSRSKGY